VGRYTFVSSIAPLVKTGPTPCTQSLPGNFKPVTNCFVKISPRAACHFLLLNLLIASPCLRAEGMKSVMIDGEEKKDITRVTLRPDGRVMVIFDGGGGQYPADKLPKDFLASWGIGGDKLDAARQEDFEKAVRQGKFRVVDGVVYDLRQPQPSWTSFQGVALIQRLNNGAALVDTTPDQPNAFTVHVLNLPNTVSDRERFSFSAKQKGTYEYVNKNGNERVVRSYTIGRAAERAEIPDEILKNGKASAQLAFSSSTQRDVLADLPQSDSLLGNGTGFLITEDGYLITNDHVVRGVRRVKVRIGKELHDAQIIKTDQKADLALLKVNADKLPALPMVLNRDATLGDEVFTIGFPNVDLQGIEPKYTDGRISSLAGLHDDPTRYQISVPVQPGNSGGPLLDSNGRVVGVVVARISDIAFLKSSGTIPQNINYAIKSSSLRDFLKSESEVTSRVINASEELKRDAAIKQGQASTVMVLGYK
jgi:S1-C subfamily serine protease